MDENERKRQIDETLAHARGVEAQLQEGGEQAREAARKRHNAHVEAELERARQGETIDLSSLMAGKEAFIIDEIERGER
jgi:predicted phage tail protein